MGRFVVNEQEITIVVCLALIAGLLVAGARQEMLRLRDLHRSRRRARARRGFVVPPFDQDWRPPPGKRG